MMLPGSNNEGMRQRHFAFDVSLSFDSGTISWQPNRAFRALAVMVSRDVALQNTALGTTSKWGRKRYFTADGARIGGTYRHTTGNYHNG